MPICLRDLSTGLLTEATTRYTFALHQEPTQTTRQSSNSLGNAG